MDFPFLQMGMKMAIQANHTGPRRKVHKDPQQFSGTFQSETIPNSVRTVSGANKDFKKGNRSTYLVKLKSSTINQFFFGPHTRSRSNLP